APTPPPPPPPLQRGELHPLHPHRRAPPAPQARHPPRPLRRPPLPPLLPRPLQHRQRQARRPDHRPAPLRRPVRLAPDRVLHHLHPVRVDDGLLPALSRARLHQQLCVCVGRAGVAAGRRDDVSGPAGAARAARGGRGGVRGDPHLPLLLLPERRTGVPHRPLHQRRATRDQLRQHARLAH
ncbi:hypothetical protein LTR53_018778, partial [Teratosphaeriaceae sp. CCFEE 6253]